MGSTKARKMLILLGALFSGGLGITVLGALPFTTEASAKIAAN